MFIFIPPNPPIQPSPGAALFSLLLVLLAWLLIRRDNRPDDE